MRITFSFGCYQADVLTSECHGEAHPLSLNELTLFVWFRLTRHRFTQELHDLATRSEQFGE